VILLPTFRCGLRCQHCDLWRLQTAELEPELWQVRLLELGGVVRRPLMVGISGGEPLLYRGLPRVIEACKQAGFITSVNTSTAPLTRRALERLLQAGLDSLAVSIDGLEACHDHLRRRRGLHAQVLQTIAWAKKLKPLMNISVVTTVMSSNADQLVQLALWADRQPEIDNICFHTLSANLGSPDEQDPTWHRRSPIWPGGMDRLYTELDQLMLMADQGYPLVNRPEQIDSMQRFFAEPDRPLRPCDQYDHGMILLPDGGVMVCPVMGPVANLRDNSLVSIWRSEPVLRARRQMARCERSCHFITNFAYQRHEL
jgi:MoaA/NifB/PqqE/SkfB family radical SAM enzyme